MGARPPWRWRPPQPWAEASAWTATVVAVLPSVWRLHALLWGAGWPSAPRTWRSWRALRLGASALGEAAAGIACLGLAQRWGERFPPWLPRLGDRDIPRVVVLTASTSGAVALTLLTGDIARRFIGRKRGTYHRPTEIDDLHGPPLWFFTAHYVPALLWPPALSVAIIGYALRSRPGSAQPST